MDNSRRVGKRIGGNVYLHRTELGSLPAAVLKVVEKARPGFEFAVVRWCPKARTVALIECTDFDQADEPTVGRSHLVRPDGSTRTTRPPRDPWVYHHKWMMVADTYTGFDVAASRRRSASWEALGDVDRSRIGKRAYWEANVVPRINGTAVRGKLTQPIPAVKASTLKVVSRLVSDLRPDQANARRHGEHQVAALAQSIASYGFNNPVLIDEHNQVIAGHGRLEGAKRCGLLKVPCIVLRHLTEKQRRAYVIADNRLGDLSEWDEDLLAIELSALTQDDETDFDAMGITDEFVELILGDEFNVDKLDDQASTRQAPKSSSVFGGATAMSRTSAPIKFWTARGLLKGDVLDFGCGNEKHAFAKYDAFHAPDPTVLRRAYDVVMTNYVLNVQPSEHLIVEILALLSHLVKARGRVLIAVRNDIEQTTTTDRGTQLALTVEEWSAHIEQLFAAELVETDAFFGWVCRPLKV